MGTTLGRGAIMLGATISDEKRVFATLDGMRGVASVLIVVRHLSSFFAPIEYSGCYLAVDFFFVISGFVLGFAYDDRLERGLGGGQFFLIRMIRLYPLYALGIVPGVVAALMDTHTWTTGASISVATGLGFFMLPAPVLPIRYLYPLNIPAWSLLTELIANIFYGTLWKHLTRIRLVCIVAIAWCVMVVGLVRSPKHLLEFGFTLGGLPGGLARVFFSFFVGLLIYRQFVADKPRQQHSDFLSCLVLLAVGLVLTAPVPITLRPVFDLGVATLISPALVIAAVRIEPTTWIASVFRFLGLISYAVYVLHQPIGDLIEQTLQLVGFDIESAAPYAGFAFLIFLVPFCWWLDKAYDTPIRSALSKALRSWSTSVREPLPSRD